MEEFSLGRLVALRNSQGKALRAFPGKTAHAFPGIAFAPAKKRDPHRAPKQRLQRPLRDQKTIAVTPASSTSHSVIPSSLLQCKTE
jgi:hypothetical protein